MLSVLIPKCIATEQSPTMKNSNTSGIRTLVLSYKRSTLSKFQCSHWIQTELSHDVLNPAHVPL